MKTYLLPLLVAPVLGLSMVAPPVFAAAGANRPQIQPIVPPGWTELAPADSPGKRGALHAASDGRSAYVFGGNLGPKNFSNDLWRFDGGRWIELSKNGADGAPPPRRWGSLVYDHARRQLVLFGGQDPARQHLGDTWTWDGKKWSRHRPENSPASRCGHSMSYDWTTKRIILFGGSDGRKVFGETWAWDGKAWARLNPKHSPPARWRQAMTTIQLDGKIILFAGTASTNVFNPPVGDMWSWDGVDWTEVPTRNTPYDNGVLAHAMIWDARRHRLVVFGGFNGNEKGDTYEFHAGKWTKQEVKKAPTARSGSGMVYLPRLGKTVLFGGFAGRAQGQQGDTWVYGGPSTPPP